MKESVRYLSTNDLRAHFGQCNSTKKDPFVQITTSLKAYWKTIYVYARSIRYRINCSMAVEKRTSFNELLNFSKQFCRPPTVICLIKRAADNLIIFQAVVKKRLSQFELLKCCRIFPTAVTDRLRKQQGAYSTLSREKGCQVVSYDTFQIFGTHRVYNQSTVEAKRSSIHTRYSYPQFRHSSRITSCITR